MPKYTQFAVRKQDYLYYLVNLPFFLFGVPGTFWPPYSKVCWCLSCEVFFKHCCLIYRCMRLLLNQYKMTVSTLAVLHCNKLQIGKSSCSSERLANIELHRVSHFTKHIGNPQKVNPRTTRFAVAWFRETESGRPPPTATATRNKEGIQKRIHRNPRRSVKKMVNKLRMSQWSVVRNIIGWKPKCRSYILQKSHARLGEIKRKRVVKLLEAASSRRWRTSPFLRFLR